MAKASALIRRYGDRRLYDTAASAYVKLDGIARMVREGRDIQVVDARSGRDITSSILTRIIVDDARDRDNALPLQLLRHLIRASDRATHDFVSWYLSNTFELFQKAQDAVHSRLSGAKSVASNPIDFVRRLLPVPFGAGESTGSDAKELELLRERVKILEAQLADRRRDLAGGGSRGHGPRRRSELNPRKRSGKPKSSTSG